MFEKPDDQSGIKTEENTTQTTNTFDDKLKEIVNEEGKPKYSDLDKALDALKHSQEFIPKLETDNKTLREQLDQMKLELEKRAGVEEVVNKILASKEDKNKPEPEKEQPSNTGVNEKSVEEILSSLLEKRSQEESKKANQSLVEKAFVEKFGDSAETKFQELAKETNLSVEELQELSAKSPNMVLKLIPDSKPAPKVNSGGFNTAAMFNKTEEETTSLQRPTKSVLAGATSKELAEEMRRHRDLVYKKLQIET
jgi:hypothetical protein